MKKIITTLLMTTLCFALASCGSSTKEENYNGLSYKYSNEATRSETDYGIEYDYGDTKGSKGSFEDGFIITVQYEVFDSIIYESATDMLASWMIEISGNDDYYNLEDDSVKIDGNKALVYKYSLVPDSPVTCESIFLLHGDKVLKLSAYGITNKDCVKELDNIIGSMKIE